jgi:cell shape-determining protein MreC
MTYLSDKKRAKAHYKVYFILFVCLVVLIYTWQSIQKIIHPITEPIAYKYNTSKSILSIVPSSVVTFFSSKYSLARKNSELEISIERLENELAKESSQLREVSTLVGADVSTSTPVVVMYPLIEDITSIYSTVLLSKGFKDGVTVNSVIYIRGRQAVCFVKEVYTNSALCKFLSAYGETIEGVSKDTTLYLKGNGGGTFISDIPRGSSIAVGDVVFLKKDQTMTLGSIVNIERDDQAAFWKVYVRGGYNPITSHIFYTNQ